MDYRYFGFIAVAVLIMGSLVGENPSFPNKVIIRISGVFLSSLGWLDMVICKLIQRRKW